MARFLVFLPSLIVIVGIAGVTGLLVRMQTRHLEMGKLEDKEWMDQNSVRLLAMIGAPTVLIVGPCVEELVFRAPLILCFDGLSTKAWYGIGVSTLLFAVAHAFGEGRSNQSVGRRILHVVTRLPTGVMFGYFGVRSQTLWAPLALHIAWNAAAIVIVPIVTVLITIVIGLIRYMIEEVKYQFWKRRYLNGSKP